MSSSTISGNVTLSQTLVNGYTWPVNVSGGTVSNPIVVTFGPSIVLTASNNTFVVQNNTYVVFEGSNNTVDVSGVTGFQGLFQCLSTNTNSSLTVNNLGLYGTNSTLYQRNVGAIGGFQSSGWFIQWQSTATVHNCFSTGALSVNNTGGIFGGLCSGIATFCYSTGAITGGGVGGIFGTCAGKANAINCYSTGAIRGSGAGGIFGYSTNFKAPDANVTRLIQNAINCYSTGVINTANPNQSGGIYGYIQNGGNYNAINCYSLGNITNSTTAGGIYAGADDGYPAMIAANCYSAGTMLTLANGIYGQDNGATNYWPSNNYVANGNWLDASANKLLIRSVPDLSNNNGISIGQFWTSIAPNTPFFLSSFNETPYTPYAAASYVENVSFTSLRGSTEYNQYRVIQNVGPAGSVVIDPSSGILTFSNFTDVGVDTVSVFAQNAVGGYTLSNYILVVQAGCFLEGTMIKVLMQGQEYYVPIETLKQGDVVLTQNKGARKVKYIGYYECGNGLFKLSKTDYPALFTDLVVTGGHPILVDTLSEAEKVDTLKIWPELRKNGEKYRLITKINSKALPYVGEEIMKVWDFVLENNNVHENFAIFANGQLTECMEEDYFLKSSGLKQL